VTAALRGPGPVVIAADLDQTLIFSPQASDRLGGGRPATVVERIDGRAVSEMADAVAAGLRSLPDHVVWVPTTTRTVAQVGRVVLPVRAAVVIAASGGIVLVDGRPDPAWSAVVAARLADVAPPGEILDRLGSSSDAGAVLRTTVADGLFCTAIVDPGRFGAEQAAALQGTCGPLGWRVAHQGRKVYVLPHGLDKVHAVAHVAGLVAARVGTHPRVLAAGDTGLDRGMLDAADAAWVPHGSELERAGGLPPHVTITAEAGHAAATEIVEAWLRVTAPPSTPRHDPPPTPPAPPR
jgi:hypothetical protein